MNLYTQYQTPAERFLDALAAGDAFALALVITPIIVFLIWAADSGMFSSPPPRPKTIEDMAQEAAWLRARGNLAEAEQDYKLKQAALHQTENFIKQNIRK